MGLAPWSVTRYIKDKRQWECLCKCGRTFFVRSNVIKKRVACISCTASLTSAKTHKDITHYGYKQRLFKEYKDSAIKRNLAFDLSFEYFIKLLQNDCVYCGEQPQIRGGLRYMVKTIEPLKRNGIDRINTTKGYVENNVVSCCPNCNYAKHEMTVEEFKTWIIKIYNHLIIKGSMNIAYNNTLK